MFDLQFVGDEGNSIGFGLFFLFVEIVLPVLVVDELECLFGIVGECEVFGFDG